MTLQAFYSAQAALAYSIGNIAHGLANNGMTDAERAALSPSDPEYQARYVHEVIMNKHDGGKCQMGVSYWVTDKMFV